MINVAEDRPSDSPGCPRRAIAYLMGETLILYIDQFDGTIGSSELSESWASPLRDKCSFWHNSVSISPNILPFKHQRLVRSLTIIQSDVHLHAPMPSFSKNFRRPGCDTAEVAGIRCRYDDIASGPFEVNSALNRQWHCERGRADARVLF